MPLWLWWVIVGLIAGFLAGKIMRGSGFGVIGDIILGILGAFLGTWLVGVLGIHLPPGIIYTILIATLGAVVLVAISRLFRR
jgi:uncharacterized membrane protein YeaQ/YmgE (transglycosylase-associated protein family)